MTNMKFKERHFKLCFLMGKKLKLLTLASMWQAQMDGRSRIETADWDLHDQSRANESRRSLAHRHRQTGSMLYKLYLRILK